MGLDFFTAVVPAPISATGEVRYPADAAVLAELHERVDALAVAELLTVAETAALGEPDDDLAEDARVFLHGSVDEVFGGAWFEMVLANIGGRHWLVTGGLSACDLPYAFGEVAALGASGITDEPLGLDAKQLASRRSELSRLGDRLVRSLLPALETGLRARFGDDHGSQVLRDVERAVGDRQEELAQVLAHCLRRGRSDELA